MERSWRAAERVTLRPTMVVRTLRRRPGSKSCLSDWETGKNQPRLRNWSSAGRRWALRRLNADDASLLECSPWRAPWLREEMQRETDASALECCAFRGDLIAGDATAQKRDIRDVACKLVVQTAR